MSMSDIISLRQLEEKDAPLIFEWVKDPDINQHFRFDSDAMTIDSVLGFIHKSQDISENAHFAIVDDTDEYMGTVSLKNIDKLTKTAEYAIAIRKKAQRKGYGRKSSLMLLDYAFNTIDLNRVYLNVMSNNVDAINLYENLGFTLEGELKDHIMVKDKLHSLQLYRIMKDEYVAKHSLKTVSDVKMMEFEELGDKRGHLVVVEGCKNIPFEIKRVFYIFGSSPDVIRGQHANARSSFCLINVSGKSKVKVVDQSGNTDVYHLDRPHVGLYIPPMIWKDMYDFSPDSVLLVISDTHYDNKEYIRDYDNFLLQNSEL